MFTHYVPATATKVHVTFVASKNVEIHTCSRTLPTPKKESFETAIIFKPLYGNIHNPAGERHYYIIGQKRVVGIVIRGVFQNLSHSHRWHINVKAQQALESHQRLERALSIIWTPNLGRNERLKVNVL